MDLMDIPASSLADLSAKQGEEVTLESVAGRNQRMMTKQIDQNNLQILKNQLEKQRDIARLNSLGLPFAGAWLVSAPVVSLGLHLQPHEFVLALKYRLGMAIYDREGPCPACLRPSDRFGDHALCCGFWGRGLRGTTSSETTSTTWLPQPHQRARSRPTPSRCSSSQLGGRARRGSGRDGGQLLTGGNGGGLSHQARQCLGQGL